MSTATETLYTPLTIANAPEDSKPVLENIQKSFGFIPNLMAIFANNPTVLEGYLALDAFYEKGSFTPRERQLILLAASVENHCNYCAAAHSTVAKGCDSYGGKWAEFAHRIERTGNADGNCCECIE